MLYPHTTVLKLPRAPMAALFVLLISPAAEAQVSQSSCLLPPAKLQEGPIQAFRAQPRELLGTYPDGGIQMAARVRRIAASDVSTVAFLVALAKEATPAQIIALGLGLAKAAVDCERSNPKLKEMIAKLVSEQGSGGLTSAFEVGLSQQEFASQGESAGPATAAPIGNLRPAAGASTASPSSSGGGRPSTVSDLSLASGRIVDFGSGGLRRTFGRSVSPSR